MVLKFICHLHLLQALPGKSWSEDIRKAFEATTQQAEGDAFKVTFSCGIAEFPDFASGSELSEAADQALYEAKNTGRNRVVKATRPSAAKD